MKGLPVFKSPQTKAAVFEAYEAVLARWPIPHERLRVATEAGETAVLAFEPRSAPPGSARSGRPWA
jgi:hypothetical protein